MNDAEERCHHILVSVHGATTTKNDKAFDNIEHLPYLFLMNNITKHSLVPSHEYVPDDEAKVIISSYLSKKNQLPILLSTDPVAVFCGFLPGDVVKIKRKSFGGFYASHTLYRRVV